MEDASFLPLIWSAGACPPAPNDSDDSGGKPPHSKKHHRRRQSENILPVANSQVSEQDDGYHGFGIIGCGMIAEFLPLEAINEIENARSGRGTWSRNAANADKIAKLAREAVRRCRSGCITGPPGARRRLRLHGGAAHMEPAVQAAGPANVVVEKPLEITLPRCDAIISACDTAGVRLCTIFPSRFTPANLRLKEAIELGRFGRLTLGDTHVKWWRCKYYDSGGWRGHSSATGAAARIRRFTTSICLVVDGGLPGHQRSATWWSTSFTSASTTPSTATATTARRTRPGTFLDVVDAPRVSGRSRH